MDLIISGLFGLLGAVLGAALAGMHQRKNTQKTIEAEFKRIHEQIAAESKARFHARKEDHLMDCVAALVTETDPELKAKLDYEKIVSLIHKIQIVLDPRSESQGKINHWSSSLGFLARDVILGNQAPETLLKPQGELIEATRSFLRRDP